MLWCIFINSSYWLCQIAHARASRIPRRRLPSSNVEEILCLHVRSSLRSCASGIAHALYLQVAWATSGSFCLPYELDATTTSCEVDPTHRACSPPLCHEPSARNGMQMGHCLLASAYVKRASGGIVLWFESLEHNILLVLAVRCQPSPFLSSGSLCGAGSLHRSCYSLESQRRDTSCNRRFLGQTISIKVTPLSYHLLTGGTTLRGNLLRS